MKLNIKLSQRKVDTTVKLPTNLPPLLHRLYASRGIRSAKDLEFSVKNMLSWTQLSGIEKAVNMLYKAFHEGMHIVIVGDFDVDGATSTALSILSLRALGYYNISYLIPNRFKDDYGLSPRVVKQAHSHGAQIIMTVDNGISSHTGINYAYKLGISVLITDHHIPGEILPAAEAIINPNLKDCNFPSKSLSGVGVVFYLMLALRAFLYKKGWFEKRGIAIPNLAHYLDLVALGTIADAVPLDANNRIITWQGLSRMRAGQCCRGIQALIEITNCDQQKLTTNDLGFAIGPRLNAVGRLHDMSLGVSLLLCKHHYKAKILAHKLDVLNKTRKEIEKKMKTEAFALCKKMEHSKTGLPSGIAIYHPNWHQGIIGILASRIKDKFHRPVIAFASTSNGILKGSGRSINELHICDAIKHIDKSYPGLILQFGGHMMAVGLSLKEKNFKKFQYLFEKLMSEWMDPSLLLQKEVISDGPLLPNEMTVGVAKMLRDAAPWGQMFPEPAFDGYFRLLNQKLICNGQHLKVLIEPIEGGPMLNGVIFNVDNTSWPNDSVQEVHLLYKLNINKFYGRWNLQIVIDDIWIT